MTLRLSPQLCQPSFDGLVAVLLQSDHVAEDHVVVEPTLNHPRVVECFAWAQARVSSFAPSFFCCQLTLPALIDNRCVWVNGFNSTSSNDR